MENKRTYGKAITNLVLAVVIGILMITVLPKCLSFFISVKKERHSVFFQNMNAGFGFPTDWFHLLEAGNRGM